MPLILDAFNASGAKALNQTQKTDLAFVLLIVIKVKILLFHIGIVFTADIYGGAAERGGGNR